MESLFGCRFGDDYSECGFEIANGMDGINDEPNVVCYYGLKFSIVVLFDIWFALSFNVFLKINLFEEFWTFCALLPF